MKTAKEIVDQLRKDAHGGPIWAESLLGAGLIPVKLNHTNSTWVNFHQLLVSEIGEDRYTWTGSIFWFDCEEYASWAALKFGTIP